MSKIGFRSFIYGMVKKVSTSLFDEWKSDEEEKASKEQSASFLASGVTAFGNVGGAIKTLGFDPFTTYREAISRGQGRLMFQIQREFTPLLNEIRWNSNRLNLTTGDVFLRNSEGLAIGQTVGTVIQGIATAIYPPLAVVWAALPWLGGMFGVGIQDAIENPNPIELWNPQGYVYLEPTGDDIDIYSEPTVPIPDYTPTRITRTMPKGLTGRIKKLWRLELSDLGHWT